MDNIVYQDKNSSTFSKNNIKNNEKTVSKRFKTIEKTYQSLDKNDVNQALNNNIENVLYSLLGEKNTAHSNSQTWSYGSNKGSLKITMNGPHKGQWRDWSGSNSDHGNLITLIMREKGLEFKDALEYAASTLVSVDKKDVAYTKVVETKKQEKTIPKTFKYAETISKNTIPIKGTLAEKYLKEHRGIEDTSMIKDVGFNAKVYSREDGKNHPALVSLIKNSEGKLTGVEAIYLDPQTNNKADLNVVKRSYGSKASSAINIQADKNSNISYLAEGLETTLSIKDSVSKDSHVLAVSGKNNFTNIDPNLLSDKVVLCLDNNGVNPKEDKVISDTISRLESYEKEVYTTMPNDVKTDFNDLLKNEGSESIRSKIAQDIAQQFNLKDRNLISEITEKLVDQKSSFDAGSYIEEMKN